MKPMSLLSRGIVLSVLVASGVLAQQRPPGFERPNRPASPAALATAQHPAPPDPKGQFTPPAPRGDLRGDIASNVRGRPDVQPGEDARSVRR